MARRRKGSRRQRQTPSSPARPSSRGSAPARTRIVPTTMPTRDPWQASFDLTFPSVVSAPYRTREGIRRVTRQREQKLFRRLSGYVGDKSRFSTTPSFAEMRPQWQKAMQEAIDCAKKKADRRNAILKSGKGGIHGRRRIKKGKPC